MGQETRAFDAAYKKYKLAAREYRGEVKELITGEIDRRKQAVSDTYQTQIDKIMGQQDKLRKEAIARLESFIFRHRDHPRYTPDAVFRLAELYYEDSKAASAYSQDHFEELECLYKRGKLLDPPVEEDANYKRSIALYKYLHWVPPGTRMSPLSGKLKGVILPRRWPNYRHADAALYLQGFCEQEMGETDRAIATYGSIAKHYPKSRYIAEAWLRVGEIYFDESEFEQAADAYRRAAEHAKKTNDAKFYELALYKLGWAYFQMYRYPEAVGWFQKLIEFSDSRTDKKKQGMDLRKEAIEYWPSLWPSPPGMTTAATTSAVRTRRVSARRSTRGCARCSTSQVSLSLTSASSSSGRPPSKVTSSPGCSGTSAPALTCARG